MGSNMANFEWWHFFLGGFAEFFAYGARTSGGTLKGIYCCVPVYLRRFEVEASGASAVLKITISSHV